MTSDARPPSAFLPALKSVQNLSEQDISNVIARLRFIYLPEVRGSTRRRPRRAMMDFPASHGDPKSNRSDNNVESIRNDAFERSFSIQWLMRFISVYSELDMGARMDGGGVLEQAASLLAMCAGATASGNIMRTFTFSLPRHGRECPLARDSALPQSPGSPGPTAVTAEYTGGFERHDESDEIHVALRDAPLESADISSVGAQTWGGSCVLAEMIVENPESFGIDILGAMRSDASSSSQGRPPFRALELGAGTGLAGLALGKLLARFPGGPCQERAPDTIVVTDFHPSVLTNLKANVEANFPSRATPTSPVHTNHFEMDKLFGSSPTSQHSYPQVVVLPLDWSSIHAISRPGSSSNVSLTPDAFLPTREEESHSQVHTALPDGAAPSFSPLHAPFDLIIGADIIYEHLHARWVRSCVERFLRKPYTLSAPANMQSTSCIGSAPAAQPEASSLEASPLVPALFHLIIPLRRTHAPESRSVEEVFPAAADICAARQYAAQSTSTTSATTQPPDLHAICDDINAPHQSPDDATAFSHTATKSHAPELAILSKEDLVRDAYTDQEETEEVVYRYYKIGWI